MRQAGVANTAVWRWQERFMQARVDGLLRDKTRPSRIPPPGATVAERVVALTLGPLPGDVTHWTAAAMAGVAGISVSSVQRIWRSHGRQPHRVRAFKLSSDPKNAVAGFFAKLPEPASNVACPTRGPDLGGVGIDLGAIGRHRADPRKAKCRYRHQDLDGRGRKASPIARPNVTIVSWSGCVFAAAKRMLAFTRGKFRDTRSQPHSARLASRNPTGCVPAISTVRDLPSR